MKPTIQPNTVLKGTILRRIGKADLLRKVVGSSMAALFTLGSLAPFAQAGQTWDGGNATGNWNDANNWNPDGVANFGLGIIFAGNTQVNTNNNATAVTTGITFDNTAGAFILGGNAITNTGAIINQSANGQTINLAVTLGNSQVWQTTAAGALTVNGNVLTNGNTLTTTAGAGAINFGAASVISGTGGLTHTAGSVVLSGVNTYTGATAINGGILTANNAAALGGTGTGTTVASGASLLIANGIALGAEPLNINGAGTAGAPGALTQAAAGSSSFAGAITVQSNSTINTNGAGVLTLTGGINKTNVNLTLNGGGTINVNTVGIVGNNDNAFNDDLIVDAATTVNLNVANTYEGPTFIRNGSTVNANVANALPTANGRTRIEMDAGIGNLNLGASQAIASLVSVNAASTMNLNANTLTIGFGLGADTNGTAGANFTGVISGAGNIIKDQTSTQVFSGNNTYAGTTNVNAGILIAGSNTALGAVAGSTTVANGAALQLANGVAVGAEPLFINGAGAAGAPGALTQVAGASSSFAGLITLQTNSTINTNGAGVLTLTGGIVKTDLNLTLNGGGTINVNTVGISGDNDNLFNDDLIVDGGTTVNLNVANTYEGPTFIRNGSTVNANVINALPGSPPGRTRIEMDQGLGNLNLGANQAIASVTSLPGQASTINLNGNTLTIGFGSGENTNGTAGAVFAGVISGTGALTKDDNSTQILTGVNTYTGFTTINGGVLQIGNANVLPGVNSALGPNLVFVNAGNLDVNLMNNGAINNTIFTVLGTFVRAISNVNITNTIAGPILGTGGLQQNGAGTTILTNTNLYTGDTTVNAGVLQVGNGIGGSIAAASAVTVVAGATLNINLAANGTFGNNVANAGTINAISANINTVSGVITGNGAFNQNGTGRTIITGNSPAFNGVTTVNVGTLQIGDGTANTSIVNSGTIGVNGTATLAVFLPNGAAFANNVNLNAAGTTFNTLVAAGTTNFIGSNIVGAANTNILQSGAGTAILTGNNAGFAGTTTIAAGTLQLGNAGVGGALGAGPIVNNGILVLDGATQTYANVISGTGSLVKQQAGTTTTLTGNNTYSGVTTVAAGTLVIGLNSPNALGSTVGGTVVADNATLNLNGNIVGAETVQLGSLGAVGANLINNAGAPASLSGAVVLASNANINTVTAADDITLSGSVSGNNFSLNKNGAGTLILSGVNTYAGVTNLNAGTIQIGNAAALGSVAGNTVVNAGTSLNLNGFNIGLEPLSLAGAGNGDLATVGALQNSSAAPAVAGGPVVLAAATTIGTHAGSITLDGVISDPNGFALTKVGVGTLVHNGANTYTGVTNINQGILIAGNAAALGAIGAGTTVANGAALQIANGINVNAEPLNINGNGTGAAAPGALTQVAGGSSSFAGPITVQTNSTISTNGAGTLTLTGGITKTNVNLTLNGGGTINVNTVGIVGNNDNAFNDDLIVDAATTVNLNVANTYEGPTFIRNGSTVNANVANALPTVNGRTRIEMDAGIGNLNLGASQAIASLVSVNAASTVNLNANTLTIGFGLGADTNGTAGANFTGVISGAGNIIKDQTSTQVFSGNNTYTGTTNVNAGILIAGSNNALGAVAGSTTVANGAALQLANGVAVGAEPLFINGAGAAGAPGALTQVAGASSSFAGLITLQSNSTINTNGAGVLTLSGGIVKTDLNLTLNGGGTINVNTVGISGDNDNLFNDDLIVDAGTTVNLNVANTYEGPTFIRNGSTVNANVVDALPTLNGRTRIEMDAGVGNLNLGANQSIASLNGANVGSTVNLGGNTLTIGFGSGANTNGTANANFAGVISGVGGSIIKDDNSTQIFSGNNTYTGTTNINAGILIAGSANALGSVAGSTTVATGASLMIANGINVGAEPLFINGAGNGGAPGALTQAAGGTSSFAGAITLQSNSTISTNGAGTLTLTGGINKTDLTLTLNGGGTINVNTVGISGDNDNLFNDDLIVDAGTTVNLNVANTYEGPTFIRNGSTVNANVANALPTANGRTRIEMDAGVGNLALAANNAAASITSLAGQASTIALGGNTLTIGFGNGQNTNGTANANFRGTINGAGGSIVKDETSTQIFSGINGYTGTTTINGGTLVVNGTHNNAGSYNIGNGAGAVEVLAGATVNNGGLNGIFLAPAARVNVLAGGSLSVGDPTVAVAASVFSISNPGNVAITMAAGSTLNVDLFTGAGLGNNQGILASSDRLNLTGTLASGVNGGVLVIGNPLGLTGFRGGDSWLLVNMGTANGAGNITGSIGINANGFNGLNDAALGLTPTQVGNFNQGTGVYTVIDTITGIQMSNILGQSVLSAAGDMLSDVNGRLFFLRAGYGDRSFNGSLSAALESGEGDKAPSKMPISPTIAPPSDEWQVFVNANYTNVQIDAVGPQQAGFDSDTWTAGLGFERSITPNFTLGFAANWLESYQDFTDNVGTLEMSGFALSAYGSYVKQNFWADLLYSFGSFDIETERNTIGFPIANGETEALTHAVQFNTGYNFRFQDNTLVTGPFIGVDYMHAEVDGFSESSGGLAALRYNDRNYDSLISRVGWSVTKKVDTDFAKITAQLRLSYERQNIKYDNQTSVSLINQPFSPNSAQQNLGQDYMVLGAGVNFQFSPRFGLLLNYQGQYFRESVQSHYIGLRGAFSF